MPELFEITDIDDTPSSNGSTADDSIAGKVACPECGNYFVERGLKRHITVTHGAGQKTRATSSPVTKSRGISIAETGKQFQQSASLLVAMACKQCATILYQDAEHDWQAIDEFCSDRPKLRKQVQSMLSVSDFMLLIGALGNTAQKMVGHHSIGKNLPWGVDITESDHNGHDPKASMAEFLMAIPEEDRNAMMNEALRTYAATS
jgi:hypothetical protein